MLGVAAGAVPGAALAAAALAVGAARRDKALHPHGRFGSGRLVVDHPAAQLGVPAFAAPATYEVAVRLSRAMGLPRSWPDIEGFALRVVGAGHHAGPADLLFASTGTSTWGRRALTLRRPGVHRAQTTLLPVRIRAGLLLLRVDPAAEGDPPQTWQLARASGRSAWSPLGRLEVGWAAGDTDERFDPVDRPLAGTAQLPLVTTLRAPAYRAARRAARPSPRERFARAGTSTL